MAAPLKKTAGIPPPAHQPIGGLSCHRRPASQQQYHNLPFRLRTTPPIFFPSSSSAVLSLSVLCSTKQIAIGVGKVRVFRSTQVVALPLKAHPPRKIPPCRPATPPRAMARPAPVSSLLLPLLLLLLLLLHSTSVSAHGGGRDDDDADAGGDADAGAAAGARPNLRARSLVLVKIWCLLLVFTATFAGGISPYFFKWNEPFLALGTQFAGGVFFGTALMHFLSDAAETFERLTEKEYPFAFMLAGAGYLLTMLADCAILGLLGRQRGGGDVPGGRGGRDAADGESFQKSGGNGGYSRTHVEAEEQNLDHVSHGVANASSLGDNILLIVALCSHSVFEGIAIGVAKNQADAWRALWTVSLHKVFAAIAMGIALLRMIPDRPFLSCVGYAFAFAISSPIGVAIGIVIDATTQGRVADWIYAISMGIACGIFIYVSINHLLAKGYKSGKPLKVDTPFNRWLAVVLGVGVIAVVMIWD